MKKEFSTSWKSSAQVRKQRKYQHNAPYHVKSTFMHAHLEESLRTKYGTRAIRVKKGDTVKIARGQFRGVSGKVERVNLHTLRVFVSGASITKRDGSKSLVPIHPSNVIITALDLSDKRRADRLQVKKNG